MQLNPRPYGAWESEEQRRAWFAAIEAEKQTATVEVDGQHFTGRVYHVRENGWKCVVTPTGHVASGPEVKKGA